MMYTNCSFILYLVIPDTIKDAAIIYARVSESKLRALEPVPEIRSVGVMSPPTQPKKSIFFGAL